MSESNKKKQKATEASKDKTMKRRISEFLELPREVTQNVPRITMLGSDTMLIENYKGIVEYENKKIRINTEIGLIRIEGERLYIKEITSEDIMVEGSISLIEFIK